MYFLVIYRELFISFSNLSKEFIKFILEPKKTFGFF